MNTLNDSIKKLLLNAETQSPNCDDVRVMEHFNKELSALLSSWFDVEMSNVAPVKVPVEVPEEDDQEFVIKVNNKEEAHFIITLTEDNNPEIYDELGAFDCINLIGEGPSWVMSSEKYYSKNGYIIMPFAEFIKKADYEDKWLEFLSCLAIEKGFDDEVLYVWEASPEARAIKLPYTLTSDLLCLIDDSGDIIFDGADENELWPTLLSDIKIEVKEEAVVVIEPEKLSIKDLKKGKIYGFKDQDDEYTSLFRFRKIIPTDHENLGYANFYSYLGDRYDKAVIKDYCLVSNDYGRNLFIPTKKQKRKLIKAEFKAKFCYELRKFKFKKK